MAQASRGSRLDLVPRGEIDRGVLQPALRATRVDPLAALSAD